MRLLLVILTFPALLSAQGYPDRFLPVQETVVPSLKGYTKRMWRPVAGMFIAGMFDNMEEVSRNIAKYRLTWLPQHPGSGYHFFGTQDQTWVNKWQLDEDGEPIIGKERWPTSSNITSPATDWFHLIKALKNTSLRVTIFLYQRPKEQKLWKYLIDGAVMSAAYGIGHHTANQIFKKRE